jgi:hypothetical protein
MWNFDKSGRVMLAVAAAAALLTPMIAMSGLVEDKSAGSADSARKPTNGYLLRCWQEGRLIVEEDLVTLPPTVDLTAAKLRALDADRHAVYVTETRNATCLIRARATEHTRAW